MPWTPEQQRVARAVMHGWKPKGSAKGFTRPFAEQVVAESNHPTSRTKKKKRTAHEAGMALANR